MFQNWMYLREFWELKLSVFCAELMKENESMRKVLIQIIYASDGCVGHRDCNHSIQPWKDARKLLGLENQ